VYCRTDAHFAPAGALIAARAVVKHVGDQPWLAQAKPVDVAVENRTFQITGDLVGTLPKGVTVEKETLTARFVGLAGQEGLPPVADDPTSPVLLLADSHGLVFHVGDDMHVKGAGLADQMTAEWKFGIDVLAARGSAATPVRINLYRKAARDADYLAGKKIIIWCFTVRELTEATGWMNVPLQRR
jgi:alginate O-acetyltransferase complex protein AlgJ